MTTRSAVAISLSIITSVAVACRLASWPIAPDSWDGVGFVAAVEHFDLAQFRPHPPGYPLFVALCKVMHRVIHSPLNAVVAVSFLFGGLAPIGAWLIVARVSTRGTSQVGRRARVSLGALAAGLWMAIAPGMVVSSTATLPDGAATSLSLFAYAAALATDDTRRARDLQALLAGVLAGACVGVRPSHVLLVIPVVLIAARGRGARGTMVASAGALAAIAAWAVPTARIVGASRWWDLSQAHLTGHLARWGEVDRSWAGEHGPAYAIAEAIALQLFGIEGRNATVIVLTMIATVLAAATLRRSSYVVWWIVLVIAPYAIGIAIAQPVAAAPRHALPLTAAFIVALGMSVENLARTHEGARASKRLALLLPMGAFAALLFVRGLAAARVHRQPPAAVAMLRFLAGDPAMHDAAVVGGRSSRFAAYAYHADTNASDRHLRVAPGALAGDAIVYAMREDPLPVPLFVTSELDLRNLGEDRLQWIATFHRDSPLDRRERTIMLYRLGLFRR